MQRTHKKTEGTQQNWRLLVLLLYFSAYKTQLFPSTLTPASYVPQALRMWMNCDIVSSKFFSAKNNVDINVPVIIVIKAFAKGRDHIRRQFCELFRFWLTSDVSAYVPLSNEAILAIFHFDMESDFSGFSGFAVIVPFILTVKEQYVLMCFDAFVVCVFAHCQSVCVGFFPHRSLTVNFQCLFLLLISSSGFNILSATFSSWSCAPYLLRAPYTWSECNFT